MSKGDTRNKLFISYASEDSDLARWLTLKLTAKGYSVWCDQFELLGGESYPEDIDKAIKNSTYRLLALLSKHSIEKENPKKERTLALNISRERNINFMIPINMDGLSPTELDWMTSDLTYIPFYKGWRAGLKQLLEKLSSINAPKPIKNGKDVVSNYVLSQKYVKNEEERIFSNGLEVIHIPSILHKYKVEATTTKHSLLHSINDWAFYPKSKYEVFSFHTPPDPIQEKYQLTHQNGYELEDKNEIEGIPLVNIIKKLIKYGAHAKLSKKGLETEKSILYFPKGLFENDKIHFKSYTGKNTTVKVVGERLFSTGDKYRYHISPSFQVKKTMDETYILFMYIIAFITDLNGDALTAKKAHSRERHLRSNWYNHQWFNRYLALKSFLSGDDNKIKIGKDNEIIISSDFISQTIPRGIDEEELEKMKKEDDLN